MEGSATATPSAPPPRIRSPWAPLTPGLEEMSFLAWQVRNLRELGHFLQRGWRKSRSDWKSYLFAPGFELSYAVCRVVFAVIFLQMVERQFESDYHGHLQSQNPALYQPIGILTLVSPEVPSAELCEGVKLAIRIGAWLTLIGFCTRLSLAVSLLGTVFLSSLYYGFSPSWSHGHPPVLLPALALLFGPPSSYSVDAWIRRLLGRETPDLGGARASVLAAQMVVAAIFLNAGLFKIYFGNGRFLAWGFSDSMRNVLLMQYWVLNDEMPALLQWVVANEWAYKGMACANLVTQLLPFLACFLIKRPWLRFLCGLCFAAEVVGLGLVMGIWNRNWLLLLALFIDWDCLAGWLRARFAAPRDGLAPVPVSAEPPRALPFALGLQWLWITAFLGAQFYVSFFHKTQRRYTYPLTAFPMYSSVYAEKPFREHRPYLLYGSQWHFDTNKPLRQGEFNTVWRTNYSMPWVEPDLRPLAQQIKATLERDVERVVTGFTIEKTQFVIAPYPDNRVLPGISALAYKYDRGRVTCIPWKLKPPGRDGHATLELAPVGLTDPQFRMGYYRLYGDELIELPGTWTNQNFIFRPPSEDKGPYFTVIGVRDPSLGEAEVFFAGPYLY